MSILQRINHEAIEGIRCGRKNNVNTSSIKEITRSLLGSKDGISYLTGFGFSKRNLIRETLKVAL